MHSWRLLFGEKKPSRFMAGLKSFIFGRPMATEDPTILSFKGLLVESLKRTFFRAWLLLGVLGQAMPDAIALLQQYVLMKGRYAWVDAICDHQTEIRFVLVVIFIIAYLIYAPYRIQRDKIQLLQSQINQFLKSAKGLQVSIEMRPDPIHQFVGGAVIKTHTELFARLTFINHGSILRTVRNVEFVHVLPPVPGAVQVYALLGATRYEDGVDSDSSAPLPIIPNGQEVIASYRTSFTDAPRVAVRPNEPNEYESHGAEFGLRIETSDGKGGSPYDKMIMAVTVSKSIDGQVSYSGKRLENISLDREA